MNKMISRQTAKELVLTRINKSIPYNMDQLECVIIEEATIEKEYGWVFFYNSKLFLETNDMSYALGGNAPIIVNKYTGVLHITGTAHPIDYFIGQYEQQLRNDSHQ